MIVLEFRIPCTRSATLETVDYHEMIAEIDAQVAKMSNEPLTPEQLRELKISLMIGFSPSDRLMSREEAERVVDAPYGFIKA